MASIKYGAINHCKMLKPSTKTSSHVMLTVPVRLNITVKNKVESPIIRAKVPTMEARSFISELIFLSQRVSATRRFLYSLLLCWLAFRLIEALGVFQDLADFFFHDISQLLTDIAVGYPLFQLIFVKYFHCAVWKSTNVDL